MTPFLSLSFILNIFEFPTTEISHYHGSVTVKKSFTLSFIIQHEEVALMDKEKT